MKKSILLLAICALALGACRSLRIRDFHTNEAIPQRLPRLGLLVHERSFLDAFFADIDRDVLLLSNGDGPYIPSPWEVYQRTDLTLSDVFQVLENDFQDNINLSGGEKHGNARFKLLYYEQRNAGWGLLFPSIATFGVANLLGMPCIIYRVDVELQMEITDVHGTVLNRYSAPGSGKGKVAAYHGYGVYPALRKANLVAVQDALSSIKTKMTADIPALTEQLSR